jgi:hypothetical protein
VMKCNPFVPYSLSKFPKLPLLLARSETTERGAIHGRPPTSLLRTASLSRVREWRTSISKVTLLFRQEQSKPLVMSSG